MRAYGAPESEIERWRNEQQQEELSDVVELPLDCVRVMELFWAVETQWKSVVAGDWLFYLGLDYTSAQVAFGYLDLQPTPAEFALLQLMEREVVDATAERR